MIVSDAFVCCVRTVEETVAIIRASRADWLAAGASS